MFKVAGVSKFKGEVKVRFANDITRVKILDKNGHTDINLVELPTEMDKPEVVKFLLTTELAQNPEFKAAMDEADEKYSGTKVVKTAALKTGGKKTVKPTKTAAKKTVATKAKKGTKSAAETMAELQARAAEATVTE